MNKLSEKIIPIFYASDENYLPYLSTSLLSLKENRNQNYHYKIYILHSGINEDKMLPILNSSCINFDIEFIDVSAKLEKINRDLQIRDYYTGATYYRIFIANMFEEYDKAIYVDSDTIILGDISKLYNIDLKNNLLGAVKDQVVFSNATFRKYTLEVLGVHSRKYFNAGVLLMNLKKFRKENLYEKFQALLKEYKFVVAQDQDYLNVLCKDRVKYLSESWNTMPIKGIKNKLPNLIHYNLTLKPWHYLDIPYSSYFWKYVESSAYINEIKNEFASYSLERINKDKQTEINLVELAKKEIARDDNYIKAKTTSHSFDFQEEIIDELESFKVI